MTRPLRMMPGKGILNALSLAVALLAADAAANPAIATRQHVDTQRSTITVRVFKAGFFRALGDNHEIRGAVKQGSINDANPAEVHIVVDAGSLRVLDPDASAADRAQVQSRMLGPEVLDANRFPEIRFDSDSAEHTGSGALIVHGRLTLHGRTQPLTVNVNADHEHYKGSMKLKQTDFGMSPISIAGGAVRVKDEVTIEFDIVAHPGVPQPTE